ncbi:hypothetical protein HPB47_007169, partial [Ixodes persulcatus]
TPYQNHLPFELPLKTLEIRNRTLATITATAAQTPSMFQPSATTSTATTMTEQQSQPTPTTPGWTIRSRQRDPKVFAGLRDEDVEDWLDSYDR